MTLSFVDYLATGELRPIIFGTPRDEVLRRLGNPSSWVSRDDPLFAAPSRDFHRSDSISFGSLTFSFDAEDRVECIMLALALSCAWPAAASSFPSSDTTISDVADLMRRHGIPFEDVSEAKDGSILVTAAGVDLMGSKSSPEKGRLIHCRSERPQNA